MRTRGGANAEQSGGPVITDAMIDAAAAIAGIKITDDQKKLMMNGLRNQMQSVATIRGLHLPNSVAPAVVFDPVPAGMVLDTVKKPMKVSAPPKVVFERSAIAAGDDLEGSNALAFLTVRELAELVKTRKVTSTELTKMYIARLKKLDPVLHCVITITEERALKSAAAAERRLQLVSIVGRCMGFLGVGKICWR